MNILYYKKEGKSQSVLSRYYQKFYNNMSSPYLPECVAKLLNKPSNDGHNLEVPAAVQVDAMQHQHQHNPIDTAKCMKCAIINKISQYTPQLHSSFRLTFKAQPNLELPLYHPSAN
ncbi:uncharacterized protein ATC70_008431 [Mucor velutinosus]|uniref:Uncharacterized protein n=1 Tax=Mucor velutinosus TaxID=708070 RepID=A0AAN7I3A1_9FUNG|nr:hypothetical protein ATC70_008431 [Mucor velutinosus]